MNTGSVYTVYYTGHMPFRSEKVEGVIGIGRVCSFLDLPEGTPAFGFYLIKRTSHTCENLHPQRTFEAY